MPARKALDYTDRIVQGYLYLRGGGRCGECEIKPGGSERELPVVELQCQHILPRGLFGLKARKGNAALNAEEQGRFMRWLRTYDGDLWRQLENLGVFLPSDDERPTSNPNSIGNLVLACPEHMKDPEVGGLLASACKIARGSKDADPRECASRLRRRLATLLPARDARRKDRILLARLVVDEHLADLTDADLRELHEIQTEVQEFAGQTSGPFRWSSLYKRPLDVVRLKGIRRAACVLGIARTCASRAEAIMPTPHHSPRTALDAVRPIAACVHELIPFENYLDTALLASSLRTQLSVAEWRTDDRDYWLTCFRFVRGSIESRMRMPPDGFTRRLPDGSRIPATRDAVLDAVLSRAKIEATIESELLGPVYAMWLGKAIAPLLPDLVLTGIAQAAAATSRKVLDNLSKDIADGLSDIEFN